MKMKLKVYSSHHVTEQCIVGAVVPGGCFSVLKMMAAGGVIEELYEHHWPESCTLGNPVQLSEELACCAPAPSMFYYILFYREKKA